MEPNNISSPIEHGPHSGKGEPWAITRHGRPLTNRQQALLGLLPKYGSEADVKKSAVSMTDLSALTAKTGVEFAMFTRGSRRLVVRGIEDKVAIYSDDAMKLRARGYKWSGHTHVKGLLESDGDRAVLREFNQNSSAIYDAEGNFRQFYNTLKSKGKERHD